jgi:hypothetical protein
MEILKFKGTATKDGENWYITDGNDNTYDAGDLLTGIDLLSNIITQEGDEVEISVKRKENK